MKRKFFATFIVSIIGFSAIYLILWHNVFDKETVAAPSDESNPGDYGLEEEYDLPVENEIVFLLMGIDAEDLHQAKGTRTDTLMLFKVNFDSGSIDILSLPRDTRVLVRGREDKLNHAHAYGGPGLTIRTVEDFLGIDLHYYVKVDFRSVEAIVDAIGGVEVEVPASMGMGTGLQTLDGKQAHKYVRFRSGYKDGDLGRIKTQQYFMTELIKQTLQTKNILKLPKLVETYFDYVETNIPMSMVLKGVGAAKNMDTSSISTNTIPGTSKIIDGLSYLVYNEEETRTIIQEVFGDYLLRR